MTAANASDVTGGLDRSIVAAPVIAKWLHLAAAPSFTIMALLSVIFDSGAPNALCSVAGGSALNGMPPMYLLMAFFHSSPWLKLMSRQRHVARHSNPGLG
jgi:hypothetical protein